MDRLLQLDAAVAERFAESCPPGNARDEALRCIARGLAIRDPEHAETWAAALTDEAERESALGEVCLRIAQTDAGDAVCRIERHPLGNFAGGLMENLVQQWAGQDLAAATTWTLARPAGEQRDQLCVRLAVVQAAAQPADAARLVLEEIPEGPIQTEALISILYQWAMKDKEAPEAWVALFPPGPLKERAESELLQLGRMR